VRPEGPAVNSHARKGVGTTVIYDGAPKVRQSHFVKLSDNVRTVAPSALDPFGVVHSTPSREWLLTDGPPGLRHATGSIHSATVYGSQPGRLRSSQPSVSVVERATRLATVDRSSAASTGFGRNIWKPASSARMRSSTRT